MVNILEELWEKCKLYRQKDFRQNVGNVLGLIENLVDLSVFCVHYIINIMYSVLRLKQCSRK
jgi:hypothetical protein